MTEEKSNLEIPLSEKLKIIPGIFGIRLGEKPLYEVVVAASDKEIRKYRPYILASITISGDFEKARKEAFHALAHYIFGQNKDHAHLKMTSPVLQEESNEFVPISSPVIHKETSNGWMMSFILPQKYSLATAPTPTDKRILLHKNPEKLVATYRYTGFSDEEKIKRYSNELIAWLEHHNEYTPIGEIQSALYDSPAAIPFLRRNEIHIEVVKIH